MTLKESIILALIDKFLIGCIVLVLALCANKALEQFKTEQVHRGKMVERHLEHLGKAWSEFYPWKAAVMDLIHRSAELLQQGAGANELRQQLSPLESRSKALSENARAVVEESRFWLGKETSEHFRHYHNDLMGLMKKFALNDFKRFSELEEELNSAEQSFEEVINQSLDEFIRELS